MTFPIPRPRGTPAPTKKPKRHNGGLAFGAGNQAIFLKPRDSGIRIENAEAGRASSERRRAIERGGI